MKSFEDWLRELGLERYAPIFADNDVGFEALPLLTEADLERLGVSLGHRRLLLKAISDLDISQSAVSSPAPAPAGEATPAGERRQITVMFCDLVGSTGLSASLDPEELRLLLHQYRTECGKVISRYEGHVARYVGDGILVYFGWPKAHEEDAERAVRAALEIVRVIKTIPTQQQLAVRIGIATGPVVVGEQAGEGEQARLAVGATPNLAARLQGLAEADQIVIAQSTRRLLGDAFRLADLGELALKGFVEPVRAWRVAELGTRETRFEATREAKGLTPLVGRETEVALLLERWRQAHDSEGQVVMLSGEPGIGKSRLVAALRERIGKEPHSRFLFQCSPFFANSAFYPIINQLERVAQLTRDEDSTSKLEKLERLLTQSGAPLDEVVPLLAALLNIPTQGRYPGLNMSPQRQKEQTSRAVVDQVRRLARQQPVLVVFEDVHWIDPTSLELLDLLVGGVSDVNALVLITFRPEFVPRWSSHAHVTAHGLNRLSRRQTADLVHRVTAGKALPERIQSQIVAKAEGVPLFIEELTKAVLEADWLLERGDRYELVANQGDLDIPATLHDSLMARLDRLIPVKEVAQIGAAIGREFSYGMLASVSPKAPTELASALERLGQSELVSCRGQPPDAVYVFKHALIQEAAYQSLLKSTRQRVHQQIAEAMLNNFPAQAEAQPEVVAHHYTQAGLGDPAVQFWDRAGRQAVARSAYNEALAHFNKALEVLQTLPDTEERAQRELSLQVAKGFALPAVKGWGTAEGKQAFTRALELTQNAPDSPLRHGALWGLWTVHTVGNEHQKALLLAKECLSVAQGTGDSGLLVESHVVLGVSCFFLDSLSEARQHFEACFDAYDAEKHRDHALSYGQDPVSASGIYLSAALCTLGSPDSGRKRGLALADFTRPLDHPHSLACALAGAAWSHVCSQDWIGVSHVAEELIAKCSEQSFPFWEAFGWCMMNWAQAHGGPIEKYVEPMFDALARFKAMGMMNFYFICLPWVAELLGMVKRAEDGLKLLSNLAGRHDHRFAEAEYHRVRGTLLEQLTPPQASEAEACYRTAIEFARRQQTKLLELRAANCLARIWSVQGKRTEARDLLAPTYGWFTEGFELPDLRDAKSLLDGL